MLNFIRLILCAPLTFVRFIRQYERNKFVTNYQPSSESQRLRSQAYRNIGRQVIYKTKKMIRGKNNNVNK